MSPVLFLSLLLIGAGSAWLWREHERAELGPGQAVLMAAKRALAANVAETKTNTGPVVDWYLQAVGIAPPANWCAAAVSAWIREGYQSVGRDPPVRLSAQAKAFIAEFEKLARWVPAAEISRISGAIPPGSVVIWSRGDPRSWTGHIGVIESQAGRTLHTIEGNSGPKGDRVARMERSLDDPRLLGIGVLSWG